MDRQTAFQLYVVARLYYKMHFILICGSYILKLKETHVTVRIQVSFLYLKFYANNLIFH